jgi:hypothetical protein
VNRIELRAAILLRADMADSQFLDDSELDLMIDSSVATLHDILVAQYGDEYWSKTAWIQVSPGTDPNVSWPRPRLDGFTSTPPDSGAPSCYPLPSDFIRLVRCQFFEGAFTWDTIRIGVEGNYREDRSNNYYLQTTGLIGYPMERIESFGQVMDFTPADWRQRGVAYRLRRGPVRDLIWSSSGTGGQRYYTELIKTGTVIEFLPPPSKSYAVQVTYVPTPVLLPDHPFPEYLIYDCAALCLEKQRSDSSILRALQSAVVQRIEQYSRTTDAANPPMVVMKYGRGTTARRREPDPWP